MIENSEEIPKSHVKKKYEGGYFTIENFSYEVSLGDSPAVIKNLCKKTLREKKKIDSRSKEINQQKILKELEIVNSVSNKEYLIQYYYE